MCPRRPLALRVARFIVGERCRRDEHPPVAVRQLPDRLPTSWTPQEIVQLPRPGRTWIPIRHRSGDGSEQLPQVAGVCPYPLGALFIMTTPKLVPDT